MAHALPHFLSGIFKLRMGAARFIGPAEAQPCRCPFIRDSAS
jgi:hypothetical protein